MIIKPLTKIMVESSPLKCTPGSLGYTIYQSQYGAYNIWTAVVLFFRIGQKGKDRLEPMILRDDMVDYKSLRLPAKSVEMLEKLELAENFHPYVTSSNDKGRRSKYVHYADHTKYSVLKQEYKDTLNMPTWEFITYIAAMSALIYVIVNGCGPDQLCNTRGSLNSSSFDPFPEQIPDAHLVYVFLMYGLKLDKRAKNKFFETRYRNFFEVPENRVFYMTILRQNLTIIAEAVKKYDKSLKDTESNERSNLKSTVNHYIRHKSEYLDIIKRSKHLCPSGPRPEAQSRLRRA